MCFRLRTILTLIVFVASATTFFVGQAVSSAQIHGMVTDPSGAAIVGANVTATQIDTGLVRATATSSEGTFSLPTLPVGPYRLKVTASGFRDYVQTGTT